MIPSPPPAIISQAFPDRANRLDLRIAADASRRLLATGQERLLRVQLAAAEHANDARDPQAPAMLDVIDRQLAVVDHTLSRAEDGWTFVVRVGDDVTVAMNDPYLWDVHISDTSALARHAGVMFVRGTQGVYRAVKPGTVTLLLHTTSESSAQPPPDLKQPITFTIIILGNP